MDSGRDTLVKEEDSMRSAEEAREVVRELRDALGRAGITLPSLGLDAVTLASDPPRPLIELGRCTAATARLLAAALRNEGGHG
ncbi:hypothetical protein ACGF1Z_09460 [Streptomyces sp. NPDC048018]|uniref:hypothetical protein n=1 Tax=Streptomyces sp. NPDC048018 TaxID=3365499 RepID=UPI003715DD9E